MGYSLTIEKSEFQYPHSSQYLQARIMQVSNSGFQLLALISIRDLTINFSKYTKAIRIHSKWSWKHPKITDMYSKILYLLNDLSSFLTGAASFWVWNTKLGDIHGIPESTYKLHCNAQYTYFCSFFCMINCSLNNKAPWLAFGMCLCEWTIWW